MRFQYHFRLDRPRVIRSDLRREAAGRVTAEALLNGVPPLVSDRGGANAFPVRIDPRPLAQEVRIRDYC
ncbi:MAG: hypothetical protein ACRD30_10320 [Bryobacteraceae bacterium]